MLSFQNGLKEAVGREFMAAFGGRTEVSLINFSLIIL